MSPLRILLAGAAIVCAGAVIFVDLKASEVTVLGVGIIFAALAAVVDR